MPATAAQPHRRIDDILDAAAGLFAERGFDGVSTRDLAAAVGLNVATVHHHVGRKAEIYAAVMLRLQERERRVLERALARLDDCEPSQAGAALLAMLDDYLDFLVAEPAAAPLWLRRWLDAPADPDTLWRRHSAPLYDVLVERLREIEAAGVVDLPDPYLLLRTVVWTTHAYLIGGLPATGLAGDPRDPDSLARFRRYLHQLVRRAVNLPPEGED